MCDIGTATHRPTPHPDGEEKSREVIVIAIVLLIATPDAATAQLPLRGSGASSIHGYQNGNDATVTSHLTPSH